MCNGSNWGSLFTMNKDYFLITDKPQRCVFVVFSDNGECRKVGIIRNQYVVAANNDVSNTRFYPVAGFDEITFINEIIMEFQPKESRRLKDCYTLNQAYYYLRGYFTKMSISDIEDLCKECGEKIYVYNSKKWIRKFVVDNYIKEQIETYKEIDEFRKERGL